MIVRAGAALLVIAGAAPRGAAGGGADRPGILARESQYAVLLDASGAPEVRFQVSIPSTAFVWMFPIAGDFDGDGLDSIGVYDPWMRRFHLRNSNAPGDAELSFDFGEGIVWPLAGDFDGDGLDTVGTYDAEAGLFRLRNSNSAGPPDAVFAFGPPGGIPVTGDFDGDGIDTIGVYDPPTRTFRLRNSNSEGPADLVFAFGPAGAFPFMGDHDGDGIDSAGVLEPDGGALLIRNSNDTGPPDATIPLEPVDWAWTPLAGRWQVPSDPPPPPGYPWPEASPEEHGIDPVLLDDAFGAAAGLGYLRSLLVLRDGYLIREGYFGGARRELGGNIKSASKSILSALVGIAAREGRLDPDDPVAVHLPRFFADDLDPAKRAIHLWHLLTMTAGLEWNEGNLAPFFYSPEWARFVLDRPVAAPPGTAFVYSTGLTHVMSRVLTAATGVPTSRFAREHLLDPLGITAVRWDRDPSGFDFGGAEVYMVPRDLARFGQLYLDGGLAAMREIVPYRWIEESTSEIIPPPWIDGVLAYGAWWWRRPFGGYDDVYFAWGYGGQFIFVFPSLRLIVVATSRWIVSASESTTHSYAIFALLEDRILPAIH